MSLWDTFRAWNPMMTLIDTTLVNNMINSFLVFYDQTGELPIWPLSSGETGTMIGYHAVSVIYDAFSKNIRGYDAEKAFAAMAYLYSFAGQPWKTQQMVRRLLKEMYQPTPEGISGNEDCGQMSAWYVMSSLGLYPVCPGSTQFILSSPLFENATVRLANGRELRITANNPEKNTYIKEVFWNDKPVAENYITYQQLADGGTLRFVLDSEPNLKRGTSPETFPYSLSETAEVSMPFVANDISFFRNQVAVNCGTATPDAEIRYTLDGTEPSADSQLYEKPFVLNNSATIKLKAFKNGFAPSATAVYLASKAIYREPSSVKPKKNGVNFRYYEGNFSKTSEIETKGRLVKSGICNKPGLSMAQIPDHYGFIFSGFINIPEDGVYTFSTKSDDGSVLLIDGQKVVNNDGSHGRGHKATGVKTGAPHRYRSGSDWRFSPEFSGKGRR